MQKEAVLKASGELKNKSNRHEIKDEKNWRKSSCQFFHIMCDASAIRKNH